MPLQACVLTDYLETRLAEEAWPIIRKDHRRSGDDDLTDALYVFYFDVYILCNCVVTMALRNYIDRTNNRDVCVI
jgi:hypothetical protein